MALAFTPGDPAGIGPDLAVQLAQQSRDYDLVALLILHSYSNVQNS